MAKIRVSTELVQQALFGQFIPKPSLQIVGGWFDSSNGWFVLEIEGTDVPDSDWAIARFTKSIETCTFEPEPADWPYRGKE